jgi:hypothetical protein
MSLATEEALAEEFNTKATLQLPQLKATAPTAPHDATSSDPRCTLLCPACVDVSWVPMWCVRSSSGKVTYLPDNRVDMAIKQALEDNKERTTGTDHHLSSSSSTAYRACPLPQCSASRSRSNGSF